MIQIEKLQASLDNLIRHTVRVSRPLYEIRAKVQGFEILLRGRSAATCMRQWRRLLTESPAQVQFETEPVPTLLPPWLLAANMPGVRPEFRHDADGFFRKLGMAIGEYVDSRAGGRSRGDKMNFAGLARFSTNG
jgi:hypothetical protein